jgi:hypothetical protein
MVFYASLMYTNRQLIFNIFNSHDFHMGKSYHKIMKFQLKISFLFYYLWCTDQWHEHSYQLCTNSGQFLHSGFKNIKQNHCLAGNVWVGCAGK